MMVVVRAGRMVDVRAVPMVSVPIAAVTAATVLTMMM
jgi:hypothetical protein